MIYIITYFLTMCVSPTEVFLCIFLEFSWGTFVCAMRSTVSLTSQSHPVFDVVVDDEV